MFTRSALIYDALYRWKDYAAEAARLHALVQSVKRSGGRRLLDVACGTGNHLPFLREHYEVEGLDVEPELIAMARDKHPDIKFHVGDMRTFDLRRRFDVVACLFSAIGYARSYDGLRRALASMASHLEPGGVLAIEPWFPPERFAAHRPHLLSVDDPGLKIARMNVSMVEPGESNDISVLQFHYLVGTPNGVEHFTERHELGLFTDEMMRQAFADCGLEVSYDVTGLGDRGLYLGLAGES
jgi:SAM-dependent methyltransferase